MLAGSLRLHGFFLLLVLCSVYLSSAQDSVQSIVADTTNPQEVAQPKADLDSARFARRVDSARRSRPRSDTSLVRQLTVIEHYANQMGKMSAFLDQGIDTLQMRGEIDNVELQIELARQGIAVNKRSPNLRNLVSTRILLNELDRQLENLQKSIMEYNAQLVSMRSMLDSMGRDSAIRIIPRDSTLAQEYVNRVVDLYRRFKPIDSTVTAAIVDLGLIQGRVVRNLLDVKDQLSIVDQQVKAVRSHYFRRDGRPIWETANQQGQLEDIFAASFGKASLILKYYLRGTASISAISILLFLVLWLSMRFMIMKMRHQQSGFVLKQFAPHLHRSVFLSSLFIGMAMSQLLYSHVPMVFLHLTWLVMFVAITILSWSDMNRLRRRIWLGIGLLFIWACLENMVLQSHWVERWLMLLISLSGIGLCLYTIRMHNRSTEKIRYFRFFAWLFLAQEIIAVVANISGVYTFGRAMAVGGFFNFVLGVMFFQGIAIVKEMVVLLYEYFSRDNRVSSLVDIMELRRNVERYLPWLAWAGWFIIFAKNLNFYDILVDWVSIFLTEERRLGNINYSFGSVVIFFLTIWISTLLARLVAFLLGGGSYQVTAIQKTRFGNSILVLRLAIISLGVLVAFAASGIPMDKVTIIIGALGVGIGFGLQNVVNNLVSGIILAFEKPIEIGDQIEIGGRLGKVREIGIRSSKLATFEGAEVIIPNGDLISQHVINWTLSHNHRRVEIIVGVKYGSHLNKAKQVLEKVLQDSEKVDKHPQPLVLVHEFNNSSIDFRLLFWADISMWMELKSEIIIAIDQAFRDAGIEIPFPQMVIHQAGDAAKD
ncbi:MAG: mechanosensitive ion channel [Chitinophagaceae bacterium]|nr:mechanosensitive ion channel [Chitinophagaceae bacterium]